MEISIVIPVFNEEESLAHLKDALLSLLTSLNNEIYNHHASGNGQLLEVLFIDDVSTDSTPSLLESFCAKENTFRHVRFSRNFGHQAAVSAGLSFARGNAVVVMDADLQDPPELIVEMYKRWKTGSDVVYAVRKKRVAPFFLKLGYKFYYKIQTLISDFPTQLDSGDFCLLDRKIVDVINTLPEKYRFVRGLRAWAGFNQSKIEFDRDERKYGKPKYNFLKLTKLALSGIISTSIKPLFFSGVFVFCSMFGAGMLGIYILGSKFSPNANSIPQGWTSIMLVIILLGMAQLITMFILSVYIARIYREQLGRPSYIIAHDSLKKPSPKL